VRLLAIRPQPGADATAKRIQALGYTAVLLPLFEVHPVAWDVPPANIYDALILSSGNAVRHAGPGLRQLHSLPVYAVGSATMKAAKSAGLPVAFTGRTDVGAVIETARDVGHQRLLWLAGEDRTVPSTPEGISLDVRIVYKSAVLPTPAGFDASVAGADIVMLHSPRAARHFAELCDAHGLDRSHIALGAFSPAVAENAGAGWKHLSVATEPNDTALLSEVQSYFTNGDRDP
jgi:uroporphyrinogen-III synthase